MPDVMSDEQILGISADVAEVSSGEAPEASAPADTQPQEETGALPTDRQAEETQTLPWQKPQQADKPQDKAQQQAKPADQNAQTFEQVFPGGVEQARAAQEAAQELFRADQAFLDGDLNGIAKTVESMFFAKGAENPEALENTLWIGAKALQERAPERFQQFLRLAVSEELGGQKVWDGLKGIYDAAKKSGNREIMQLANRLAGKFQNGYGLGPASEQTQLSALSTYTRTSDELLGREIGREITKAFGAEFSSVSRADQAELIHAAHGIIQDAMRKDPAIVQAAQRLGKAYTREEGIKIFLNTLEPKARALVPMAVQALKAQYGSTDIFKYAAPAREPRVSKYAPAPIPAKPLPRSMAEATARGMSMPEILRAVLSEEEQTASRGKPLGLEEAARMSDRDILSTARPVDRTAKMSPRPSKITKDEARGMSFSELLNDEREVG